MRERKLRQLWRGILVKSRSDGCRLPPEEREALVQERLPDLLKARYGADEVQLSEESRQDAVAELLRTARAQDAQRQEHAAETRPHWRMRIGLRAETCFFWPWFAQAPIMASMFSTGVPSSI